MTYISTTMLSETDVNVLGLFFLLVVVVFSVVYFVLFFFQRKKKKRKLDISIYIPKGVFGKLTILISNK